MLPHTQREKRGRKEKTLLNEAIKLRRLTLTPARKTIFPFNTCVSKDWKIPRAAFFFVKFFHNLSVFLFSFFKSLLMKITIGRKAKRDDQIDWKPLHYCFTWGRKQCLEEHRDCQDGFFFFFFFFE